MKYTLCVLALLTATSAAAQTSQPVWASKVTFGKPVFITTTSGETVNGTAGQISAASIVVTTPTGIRTIPMADVSRVQKHDPAWTGAVIGAGLGLAAGLGLRFDKNTCPDDAGERCKTDSNAIAVGMTALWAGMGWGLDALIKRRVTVFEAQRATTVTLGVSSRMAFVRVLF